MTASLQPSYWQQLVFGLGIIIPTLLVGALVLGWFETSVLRPRAAGRRWPEGARWVRPLVEIVTDIQRRPVATTATAGAYLQAVRFGLVAAVAATVPMSAGLVVTQAGLGLYAFGVLLAADALVTGFGERVPWNAQPATARWIQLAVAGVVLLAAGTVQAQWGTGSLAAVVTAQADRGIAGLQIWGLPTFVAQPLMAVFAAVAAHAATVAMTDTATHRRGALPGWLAEVVDRTWLVVAAAWLVAAFGGGGAVPWDIHGDAQRHAVSVAVFLTKVSLVAIGLAWARARWPTVPVRAVRGFLVVAGLCALIVIPVTLVIRTTVGGSP